MTTSIDATLSLDFTTLPARVVHEVKRRVIDTFAQALTSWEMPSAVGARRVAAAFQSTGGAQLWGTRQRVATDWAAFANSCLVPDGDPIPALFAVAEAHPANGRDLITAIALATEVQQRLTGNHTFGIALAAAKLMGLDAAATTHALGMAVAVEPAAWPDYAFANAARHAVFSALLARGGRSGPPPAENLLKAASAPFDWQFSNVPGPLTDVAIEEKFLAPANHHLTRDQVEGILHRLWRLDEVADVGEIVSLMDIVV